jgi:prolyl-tRNA editing enzyme YbaK/EbsC (Cys-tRNA(Pro) deacylase)
MMLSDSARKVQDALEDFGLTLRVVEMPQSTRTAKDAAQAIGCMVAQIGKSIIFKGARSGKAILVVASGVNRVDEKIIAAHTGEPIEKASAEFVREATGFVIGGVPPTGFATPIETWIDEDLFQFAEIWAAAGTPSAVFALTPVELARITGGRTIKVH